MHFPFQSKDCSINFIGEVERGETSPSFHYFFKICVGLKVDPNTLFKSIHDQVYEKIEKEVKENLPE
jgi:transcriptional regulator with XRE-family HTH domain